MKRRQFTPEFKAKVVMEMLREEKTISEIATEHEISPNQLRNWNTPSGKRHQHVTLIN